VATVIPVRECVSYIRTATATPDNAVTNDTDQIAAAMPKEFANASLGG
jgi:hypothetical protein